MIRSGYSTYFPAGADGAEGVGWKRRRTALTRATGNPKLETLYPLIRILNVDANTIFYSAPKTETPNLDRLMRLVSTCTEYEAHELIRIVNDILNIMRHSENEKEENAI